MSNSGENGNERSEGKMIYSVEIARVDILIMGEAPK